jgi:hypothetical protein
MAALARKRLAHLCGSDAFQDAVAHDLPGGRVLFRPRHAEGAMVVLARKPGTITDGEASKNDAAMVERISAVPAQSAARFAVGDLALWLARPLGERELSPMPSRPDLSVNLSLARASSATLLAYTPETVCPSTEVRAGVFPVEAFAALRLRVGTGVVVVMAAVQRAPVVDWTPGRWVHA